MSDKVRAWMTYTAIVFVAVMLTVVGIGAWIGIQPVDVLP